MGVLTKRHMREQEFLNIIKNQIGDEFIGDDCAFIKELGIVVTQDSLIEDIHFRRSWYTPHMLGYKAVTVNISDVLASGAKPAYITIALSLPKDISTHFVKEFYKGAKSALHGAKIIGGDITGADKICISITAIGATNKRKISSRGNAKVGYAIITKGDFGKSAEGLKELINGGNNQDLIRAHLEPQLEDKFAEEISTQINAEYAMMDTSDGLADALYKIAEASNVSIKVKNIEGIFGAEDYKLVAAVPKEFLPNISEYDLIGEVLPHSNFVIQIGDKKFTNYDEIGAYNHFEENIND